MYIETRDHTNFNNKRLCLHNCIYHPTCCS